MPQLIREDTSLTASSESVWIPTSQSESNIVTSLRRTRAISLSRQLSVSSPLYNRLLSAMLDFIIPGDTQLVLGETKKEETKDNIKNILDHFWYEGPSALMANARDLIFTLLIDGELLIKKRVNEADGKVTLTNISADNIEEIQRGEGFNAVSSITITDPTTESDEPETLKVIRRNPVGKLEGDIFYFRIFPAGYDHGLRGLPLLIHCLDELAAHSELIYTRITRLKDLSSFYWDVTMEGATQDQIDEFLQSPRATPPESGETFAHNERVSWELVSPGTERRLSTLHMEIGSYTQILIGAVGLTQEFVGQAPARDITTESLFASIAHLTAIRELIFGMLGMMIQFQMESALKYHGGIDEIPQFNIMAKEIGSRSLQRAAQAFARYADGLQKSVKEGLLDRAEAQNVLRLLLTQLGLVTDFNMEDVTPTRYIDKKSNGNRSSDEEGEDEGRRESQKSYYGVKLY